MIEIGLRVAAASFAIAKEKMLFALACFIALASGSNEEQRAEVTQRAAVYRNELMRLSNAGDHLRLGKAAIEILEKEGEKYYMDHKRPSVYHYLGVAMYNLGHLEDAANAFLQAVQLYERDLPSWNHLGTSLMH